MRHIHGAHDLKVIMDDLETSEDHNTEMQV
jgi:hypothetical protein